jgi:hypothetical protein
MKTLLQLNIFISQIENYYGSHNVSLSYERLDIIMELKKEVAKIAAFPSEKHPQLIIDILPKIKAILPCRQNAIFPFYRDKLKEIQKGCLPDFKFKHSKQIA